MIPALTFWSQPQVFTDSWVELASTITLIAFVVGVYKHLECHVGGCHRLGRFVHGRYKLCRVHHPERAERREDHTGAHRSRRCPPRLSGV